MSSARSFAGSDQQALRIAAAARAALKHYPNAGATEQDAMITMIEDSYSDLAFGTFSRADALPRSLWQQLLNGGRDVMADARALAGGLDRKSTKQKADLNRLADNVCFALSLGAQVQTNHLRSVDQEPSTLRLCWDGSETFESTGSRNVEELVAKDAAAEFDLERKWRLHCLYRRELTVKKNWEVLFDASSSVACRVVLQGLDGTEEWYAPWYVSDREPPLHPVNVLYDKLDEPAANDTLVDSPGLDRFPSPITHGALPQGMRTRAIASLRSLLQKADSATVCVLVYDVVIDPHTTKRLVLDGNHRLAAARALAAERSGGRWPFRRTPVSTDVRVLAFVLSEKAPVDSLHDDPEPTTDDGSEKFPAWRGFSPDIGLVRGTWLPPKYLAATDSQPKG